MTITIKEKCVMNKGLFKNCLFVLETGTSPYKVKKLVRSKITENGGTISYILTKKSHYVISLTKSDTYKTRRALELEIPVVSSEFIDACIASNKLVDADDFCVVGLTKSKKLSKGKVQVSGWTKGVPSKPPRPKLPPTKYVSGNKKCPDFPSTFKVAKFVILKGNKEGKNGSLLTHTRVYELHIATELPEHSNPFRVLEQCGTFQEGKDGLQGKESFEYFFKTGHDAIHAMQSMVDVATKAFHMTPLRSMPVEKIGSFQLRQLLDEMGTSAGVLHPRVAQLVHGILGLVFDSVDFDPRSITSDEVTKATVILMKIRDNLKAGKSTIELSHQLHACLPGKYSKDGDVITNIKLLSKQQDYVQLMKDCLLIMESFTSDLEDWDDVGSYEDHEVTSFYRTLNCAIRWIDPDEGSYRDVNQLLMQSRSVPTGFKILNIFGLHRSIEDENFMEDLNPKKLLLHSSDPQNFLGILSRGLLLPLVVVNIHGGERSDEGSLGAGLYFADDVSTSVKFSAINPKTGTRLLLVNEVALGRTYDSLKRDLDMTSPPSGYDSVRGVGGHENEGSEFKSNEFVVYNTNQQRIRYLVEFILDDDHVIPPPTSYTHLSLKPVESLVEIDKARLSLDDVAKVPNPVHKLNPGLNITGPGEVPLEEVHIRAKMIDLVSEVIVLQAYSNLSDTYLEAKYVFPLDDSAAVCGFEAFINGKHVIGKVKEKQAAHREYKEAVAAGHGAYLMDEEKADVFTISIGNLPPRSKVIIKITYVAELGVISCGGVENIQFTLPASIAPSVRDNTLISGEITQHDVDRVTVKGGSISNSSLVLSVEMPFSIRHMECTTHKVVIKKTDSKACVRLAKNEPLGGAGFNFLVLLAEVHVPRMWVERHSGGRDSQACMLAFYPEFDVDPISSYRAIILLDMSQSMGSEDRKLEQYAKKISLLILHHLPKSCLFNVIIFGSTYQELFVTEQLLSDNIVYDKAESFIQSSFECMGASEAWRPLTSMSWLSEFSDRLTNIFVVSDGHLGEPERTREVAGILGNSENFTSRIFTFSIGNSSNQHLLKSISLASGGAHEHFSFDTKSKWEQKVKEQLTKAKQPVLTNIHVKWKTYDEEGDRQECPVLPTQAPEHISSLFNQSRLVVYGFVPHCRQAELSAKVCGKEISTIVSVSELSVTTGKTLHHLTARALIKDYEEGLHHLSPLERADVKKARKPHIIETSVDHSVVSPHTSFVAVEERDKDDIHEEGPSISKLLDSFNVDLIPEIAWQIEHEEKKDDIATMLKTAESAYLSNITESLRLYDAAKAKALAENETYWLVQIINSMCDAGVDVDVKMEVKTLLNTFEADYDGSDILTEDQTSCVASVLLCMFHGEQREEMKSIFTQDEMVDCLTQILDFDSDDEKVEETKSFKEAFMEKLFSNRCYSSYDEENEEIECYEDIEMEEMVPQSEQLVRMDSSVPRPKATEKMDDLSQEIVPQISSGFRGLNPVMFRKLGGKQTSRSTFTKPAILEYAGVDYDLWGSHLSDDDSANDDSSDDDLADPDLADYDLAEYDSANDDSTDDNSSDDDSSDDDSASVSEQGLEWSQGGKSMGKLHGKPPPNPKLCTDTNAPRKSSLFGGGYGKAPSMAAGFQHSTDSDIPMKLSKPKSVYPSDTVQLSKPDSPIKGGGGGKVPLNVPLRNLKPGNFTQILKTKLPKTGSLIAGGGPGEFPTDSSEDYSPTSPGFGVSEGLGGYPPQVKGFDEKLKTKVIARKKVDDTFNVDSSSLDLAPAYYAKPIINDKEPILREKVSKSGLRITGAAGFSTLVGSSEIGSVSFTSDPTIKESLFYQPKMSPFQGGDSRAQNPLLPFKPATPDMVSGPSGFSFGANMADSSKGNVAKWTPLPQSPSYRFTSPNVSGPAPSLSGAPPPMYGPPQPLYGPQPPPLAKSGPALQGYGPRPPIPGPRPPISGPRPPISGPPQPVAKYGPPQPLSGPPPPPVSKYGSPPPVSKSGPQTVSGPPPPLSGPRPPISGPPQQGYGPPLIFGPPPPLSGPQPVSKYGSPPLSSSPPPILVSSLITSGPLSPTSQNQLFLEERSVMMAKTRLAAKLLKKKRSAICMKVGTNESQLNCFIKILYRALDKLSGHNQLIRTLQVNYQDSHFELKYDETIGSVYQIIEQMLLEAGARSLGPQVGKVLRMMLYTAYMVELLEETCKRFESYITKTNYEIAKELLKESKLWLKRMDSEYPCLYSRLELGSSWPAAATCLAQKVLKFM